MNERDVHALCSLLCEDFTSTYVRGGKTTLSVNGGLAKSASSFSTVERAQYMVNLYRNTPSLFTNFVRRHKNDSANADFIARCRAWCLLQGYPCDAD